MARIPYADPAASRDEHGELVDRIIKERGRMLHLYAMLLQSPPFAEGWLRLLTAVRHEGQLSGALRELMIMRVAHLNKAPYEAEQHRPIAIREGVSEAQVDAVANWAETTVFSPPERAALALCDEMTLKCHVSSETFHALRRHFDSRSIAELTITVGAYNMVSRVLEALEISSSDDMGDWS